MADVRVVMQALLDAHRGVEAVMDELAQHSVSDLVAEPSALGHEALGRTTVDFCQRWSYGIANLTDDGNALAKGLGETARSYAENERLNVAEFR